MNPGVFASPYPVVLDLADKPVLVVGGGLIGARKAAGLVSAGARVTVVSPTAVPGVIDNPAIRWHQRPYRRGEVASYRLGIAATSDAGVNAQVARDADAANVFFNSVDDPLNCTLITPAIAGQGDLHVAISTNGRSPALARWLRIRFEDTVTVAGDLLEVVSDVRDELRTAFGTSETRRWEEALDDELLELVEAGRHGEARGRLRTALGLADLASESDRS